MKAKTHPIFANNPLSFFLPCTLHSFIFPPKYPEWYIESYKFQCRNKQNLSSSLGRILRSRSLVEA